MIDTNERRLKFCADQPSKSGGIEVYKSSKKLVQ